MRVNLRLTQPQNSTYSNRTSFKSHKVEIILPENTMARIAERVAEYNTHLIEQRRHKTQDVRALTEIFRERLLQREQNFLKLYSSH